MDVPHCLPTHFLSLVFLPNPQSLLQLDHVDHGPQPEQDPHQDDHDHMQIPTKLLLSHTATTSCWAELSTSIAGSLTAVILGMEVCTKLETVV